MTTVTNDDYKTGIEPTWCPGCGAFTIKALLTQLLVQMGIAPHEVVITYDIGCNGNGADKVRSYAVKSLHGRSLLPAVGAKYANHKLPVISIIGDGGMFWEGAAHFLSLAQRNEDITVLVYDNQIYGLTTGQTSPTTPKGVQTVSTPYGAVDEPLNPVSTAIAVGATFVARGWVGQPQHLKQIIKKAILHKGFAIVDILTQCVTWSKIDMLEYYKDMVYGLETQDPYRSEVDIDESMVRNMNIEAHDSANKLKAMELALREDKIPLGVFYRQEKDTLVDKFEPLKKGSLVSQTQVPNIDDLMEEFK
ncbi:2-oxoacid ferredoxin oxidoreductase [Candidatus Dojkabacteria bacterium]|nr:2-oxoacid ferredoxin oxidoreductase [Candidatus Dojkabacteria bacterium]